MPTINPSARSGYYGANWYKLPFGLVPSLVLGSINGGILGGLELAAGGVSPGFSFLRVIGFAVAGVVSLVLLDLVAAVIFPNFRLQLPRYYDAQTGARNYGAGTNWSVLSRATIFGGFVNGLVFWGLHGLNVFQGAGWFGNAIAGFFSLFAYYIMVATAASVAPTLVDDSASAATDVSSMM